ncbi:MAG: IclR family transcriptional regulator [Anaerolineales bacterium]|nr:IclR family transcriptional regulator [Anaerolineales bacterium]
MRANRILKVLAVEPGEFSLLEISRAAKLPSSTVYRLLATLENEGLVERSDDGLRYRLGLEIFRLGSAILNNMRLEREAYPFMQKLAELSGETVNLGVLSGHSVLYLQKIESKESLRADLVVGGLVPSYCSATGKVLLAFLPEGQLELLFRDTRLVRMGPNCITSLDQLKQELALIRQRGYSIDDQEFSSQIRATGAPIWSHRQRVIAAIAVAGPATRLTPTRLNELVLATTHTASEISARLGYQAPAVSTSATKTSSRQRGGRIKKPISVSR